MKKKFTIGALGVGLVLVACNGPEAHADAITDAAIDRSGIYATCTVLRDNFTDGENLVKDAATALSVGMAIADHYGLTLPQAGQVEVLQVKVGCPELLPELIAAAYGANHHPTTTI